jgi:hypothetical protein
MNHHRYNAPLTDIPAGSEAICVKCGVKVRTVPVANGPMKGKWQNGGVCEWFVTGQWTTQRPKCPGQQVTLHGPILGPANPLVENQPVQQ